MAEEIAIGIEAQLAQMEADHLGEELVELTRELCGDLAAEQARRWDEVFSRSQMAADMKRIYLDGLEDHMLEGRG